ncbi:hypothetical protein AAMO2058_000922000 [Amorphochlora amoebiformis]
MVSLSQRPQLLRGPPRRIASVRHGIWVVILGMYVTTISLGPQMSLPRLETGFRKRLGFEPLLLRGGGSSQENLSDTQRILYEEALRILSCGDDWYQLIWGRKGTEDQSTIGLDEEAHSDQILGIIRKMRADMHPDKLGDAPDFLKMAARRAFDRLNDAYERVRGETIRGNEVETHELYKVVWPGGVVVRCREGLSGSKTHVLRYGAVVQVSERRGRRVHLRKPVDGWVSLHKEDGRVLLKKYSLPRITDGRRWLTSEDEARQRQIEDFMRQFYNGAQRMVLKIAENNDNQADE